MNSILVQIMVAIIVAFIAVLGIGFLLSDAFKVPVYAVSRAIHNLGKKQKKKTGRVEIWLKDIANWISGKVRLNEYKRMQLDADLRTADIDLTPEMFVASNILKALIIGIFAIPFLFFAKILSLFVVILAVLYYYIESKKLSKKIGERRRKIEAELPRLVATIEKALIHNRDVLKILDNYKESAGDELKHELEITTADMRSGNHEIALRRLESRVGSSMLSDVTRGLANVTLGNDTAVYWAGLVLEFSDYGRQLLKAEANKAPKRVRRLSMALLICFMAIYVVVIGQVLLGSLGGLFT